MTIRLPTTADWKIFLSWAELEGWRVPFKEQLLFQHQWRPFFFALHDKGATRGFVSAVGYHYSGWIGNLLIDPQHRGEGYGKRLLEEALKFLNQRRLKRIWLTASDQGAPLYQRYGFEQVDTVTRWCATGSGGGQAADVPATLNCLITLDQDCWGEGRRDLIHALAVESILLQQPDHLALLQAGLDVWQLGPWSAARTDPRSARLLLDTALAVTPADKKLFVDVLDSAGLELLMRQHAFSRRGHNKLMYRGIAPTLRGVMALASFGSIG